MPTEGSVKEFIESLGPPDWKALRERLRSGKSDPNRLAFFLALASRGETSEIAGRVAMAIHCRKRIESFLLSRTESLPESSLENGADFSPLEQLGERLRARAESRVEAMLLRHGHRLTPVERGVYRDELNRKVPAQLLGLRKRLNQRLRRVYSLSRKPILNVWSENRSGEGSPGPYNDRVMLLESLQQAALVDPQWVQEWSDLYARMDRFVRGYRTLFPQ